MSAAAAGVPRLLLTTSEAAAALGISRAKLYELLARGELRALKINAATRVSVAELERYVAQLEAANAERTR